jgi:uncharacterized protein with FMN-binding domain
MGRRFIMPVLAVIGAVVVALAIGGKVAFARVEKNLEGLKDMPIARVDVSKLADGDYPGAYKAFPVEVELVVRVRGGRIDGIDLLKHSNGKGKPAEALIPGIEARYRPHAGLRPPHCKVIMKRCDPTKAPLD